MDPGHSAPLYTTLPVTPGLSLCQSWTRGSQWSLLGPPQGCQQSRRAPVGPQPQYEAAEGRGPARPECVSSCICLVPSLPLTATLLSWPILPHSLLPSAALRTPWRARPCWFGAQTCARLGDRDPGPLRRVTHGPQPRSRPSLLRTRRQNSWDWSAPAGRARGSRAEPAVGDDCADTASAPEAGEGVSVTQGPERVCPPLGARRRT